MMAVDVEIVFESGDYLRRVSVRRELGLRALRMVDWSHAPQPPAELAIVQNWAEELERLVPTS